MKLTVASSPHIRGNFRTSRIMLDVVLALLPALGVGVYVLGFRALLVALVCMVSAVAAEFLYGVVTRGRNTIIDCSAMVTGLLLAMTLPASVPLWLAAVGSVFAILVVKQVFGGLGQNLFNPAIAGRVFLLISFPTYMTDWTKPAGFIGNALADGYTGATPLGIAKEVAKEGGVAALEGVDYLDMLFYNIGGSAGELSAVALLIGFAYLLIRRVIRPYITLSIWATVAVFAGIFWLINPAEFTDPVFNLLTGGLMLGSIFMATDYVTSPMSNWGGVIFGVGIGLITMLIRYFGAYPEGVSFAILIMNSVVPLINKVCHAKKYGR